MRSGQGDLSTCVVYDATTGYIVHTHSIMALPGASRPTQEELEKEALALVRRRDEQTDTQLCVLHVPQQDHMKIRSACRVDIQNQTLTQEIP